MYRSILTTREKLAKYHYNLIMVRPGRTPSRRAHSKWSLLPGSKSRMIRDLWIDHLRHEPSRVREGQQWLHRVRMSGEFPNVTTDGELKRWIESHPDQAAADDVWTEFIQKVTR